MTVDPDGYCAFIKSLQLLKKYITSISHIWIYPMNSFSICKMILENGAMKTISYLCRGMELKMQYQLGVNDLSTQYITTLILILKRKFKNISMMSLSYPRSSKCCSRGWNLQSSKRVFQVFFIIKSTTYMHQSTSHFLSTYKRHLSFATKVLVSLNKHVPLVMPSCASLMIPGNPLL